MLNWLICYLTEHDRRVSEYQPNRGYTRSYCTRCGRLWETQPVPYPARRMPRYIVQDASVRIATEN